MDRRHRRARQHVPAVTVDLAGGRNTVHRVQVSAMLNPAPADGTAVPLAKGSRPDSGSRFTALRRFGRPRGDCVRGCGSRGRRVEALHHTSRGNAFPAVRPRPVAFRT